MAWVISHCKTGTPKCWLPSCAMPGITLEKAMPTASAGNRKTKPAKGPAIPISKSARRVQEDIGRLGSREDRPFQQPLQGGNAKVMAARVCDARDHLGEGDAHGQRGQQKNETGQGTGDS